MGRDSRTGGDGREGRWKKIKMMLYVCVPVSSGKHNDSVLQLHNNKNYVTLLFMDAGTDYHMKQ